MAIAAAAGWLLADLASRGGSAARMHAAIWLPALAVAALAWDAHRESPRTMGLAFTGWRPWLDALAYPALAAIGAALLAVALDERLVAALVPSRAAPAEGWRLLRALSNGALVMTWPFVLVWVIPWLLIAVGVRYARDLDDRGAATRWAAVVFGALLLLPTFAAVPVASILAAELAFRGGVARAWAPRPLAAGVLSATAGLAFAAPSVLLRADARFSAEMVLRLLDLWCFGVILAALYRQSGSVWPGVVCAFGARFWDALAVVEPAAAGSLPGQAVWGVSSLVVFRLLPDGILALGLLLAWRRESVTLHAARLRQALRYAATTAAPSAAGSRPAPPSVRELALVVRPPVRGGLAILTVGWLLVVFSALRLLLAAPRLYRDVLAYRPDLAARIEAQIAIAALMALGGIVALYLLLRGHRHAPLAWVVYCAALIAATWAHLTRWPERLFALAPLDERHAWLILAAAALAYWLFAPRVRHTFGTHAAAPLIALARRIGAALARAHPAP
ncbi:MAG TPA: CPBP family glutamic-type intramembrane protease [Gemmatimonadaceae bacterium]|nr:CPBP family glutamic-type intramembrane protease [Gemmatimonadaceae bacterium]